MFDSGKKRIQRSSFTIRLSILLILLSAGCARMDTSAQSPNTAAAQSSSTAATNAPPVLQYVDTWGMKGSDAGHLSQPTSICADALGNIFIADAGSHFVHKFNAQGTPLLSFQDDWIKAPTAIATDRGGGIYTADAARAAVSIFFPGGDRYRDIKLNIRGDSENNLGVTVGDDGMIFVLDGNTGQVFAYSDRFRLTRTWKPFSSGRVSAIASASDGNLYVLNADESRIAKFNHDGQSAGEMSARPAGANRKLGRSFAVGNAYVFVMDGDGQTIHVIGFDGKPKLDANLAPQLGATSRAVPPLAVSPKHELFVLDAPNSRVFRYRFNF